MTHASPFFRLIGLAVALAATGLAGPACDTLPAIPGGQIPTPGTGFSDAPPLPVADGSVLQFSGEIIRNSVDVFNLGAVLPGDRVIVTVQASSNSTLDPTVAVFDENGALFQLNDDVDLMNGRLDSRIDGVVTEASNSFFLAITKFFFDPQGGPYQATVEIRRGVGFQPPPTQVLLLNFAGGSITLPADGTFNLGPFDAADIDATYAGETALIKQTIIDTVVENFAGTGLQIVSSDDNAQLEPGTFSTIHFGAFSSTKFGAAQSVDVGNLDRCDDGIVFTDDFDNPFATQPTATGIAIAIGNVAAHEAGHLLGLHHVADVAALMDTTGTASTLLADQTFKTARLAMTVFPFGDQNAPAILSRVIPLP